MNTNFKLPREPPNRHIDEYLKNGVSKIIVYVIKHAKF